MIHKNKKLILGLGSVLLVLVLIGVGAYAWYMNLSTNLIDPQVLQVTASQFLEVRQAAADGEEPSEYSNALTLEFEDLVLVDITGDGTTLVRPRLLQNAEEGTGVTYAEPDTSPNSEWVTPVANKDYIDVTLEFRSNKHLAVFLGAGSSVTPHCGIDNALNPGENDNPSNYGDFSRDLMAGAARVAFVSTGDSPATIMVWEPNDSYRLYYSAGWKFATDGAAVTPHAFYDPDKTEHTLEQRLIPVLLDSDIEMNTASISFPTGIGGSARILSLTYNEETHFYEGSVTLRVWIEGCDREARRALAGGAIDIALYLYGYEIAD